MPFNKKKKPEDIYNDPTFMFGQRPHIEDFIANAVKKFWYTGLRQDQITNAIQTACDFFNIPMPQLVYDMTNNPREGTAVKNKDSSTLSDDILQFNFKELSYVGITNLDAFTLVLTHECMHRVLQNVILPGRCGGRWEEELACDFFIGVRAALSGMNDDPVAVGLGSTKACPTHPAGSLRYEFIKQGKQLAYFDIIRHRPVTLQSMYSKFEKLLSSSREEIDKLQYPFLKYYKD